MRIFWPVLRYVFKNSAIYIFIYNFTEVQFSRVIIVLLLQNGFVWCKDHTHQAILTVKCENLNGCYGRCVTFRLYETVERVAR